MSEEFYTTREVAEKLKVETRTVFRQIFAGIKVLHNDFKMAHLNLKLSKVLLSK